MVAEFAVDVELFGDELSEHGLVAAAVGFGDLGAEFALAAFETAMFEGVQRAFDLFGERRVSRLRCVVERVGEGGAGLVGRGGVGTVGRRGAGGERGEQVGGGQGGGSFGVVGEVG